MAVASLKSRTVLVRVLRLACRAVAVPSLAASRSASGLWFCERFSDVFLACSAEELPNRTGIYWDFGFFVIGSGGRKPDAQPPLATTIYGGR